MSRDVDPTSRRRKRKALLAGGTVLGLGAAVTLAAWTDDVWVSGSFAAGTFNVQGSVDSGATWQEYDSPGTAGGLVFTVAPVAMSPGDSVYAPLILKVGPTASSSDALISLPTVPNGPAVPNAANNNFFGALRLSLYNVMPESCNASGTSGSPIPGFDNVVLTAPQMSTMLTLDKDMAPEGVCFKVTLPEGTDSTVQGGTTGALTWRFHAESA